LIVVNVFVKGTWTKSPVAGGNRVWGRSQGLWQELCLWVRGVFSKKKDFHSVWVVYDGPLHNIWVQQLMLVIDLRDSGHLDARPSWAQVRCFLCTPS